jgi:RNA polymerase sigma-70 factor (ECF subfamily)
MEMQSAKQDKQQQFMRLYEPVKDRLWRFIRSIVWISDDARDIESETILQAYINLNKLNDESRFLYFLFGIASRLLKQKERRRRLQAAFRMRKPAESEFYDPAHKLDVEILYRALKKLPHKERETLVLFEISGLSIKEIQGIMGGNASAIKTRLSRARTRLKELLKDNRETIKTDFKNDISNEFIQPILKAKL